MIVSEGAYNAQGGDGLIKELNKISNFDLTLNLNSNFDLNLNLDLYTNFNENLIVTRTRK